MAARTEIIKRTLLCIDEAYPDSNDQDLTSFNIAEFIDQAAKIVIQIVPLRVLGPMAINIKLGHSSLVDYNEDTKIASWTLPDNFQRITRFKATGWLHAITSVLDESSPRYLQQFNPVLASSPTRPAAFITKGGSRIEFRSVDPAVDSSQGIVEFDGILFDALTDDDSDVYPTKLYDITAWKTAELVLSTFNNVEAAQICQNHTKEILETL